MKTLLIALALCLGSTSAVAATLICNSKEKETLYYSEGKLRLDVGVASTELLTGGSIQLLPVKKLGSTFGETRGVTKNGFVRFPLAADAWCNYRLALPANFIERPRAFTGFVDAYCEENQNYSIRMSCILW